MNSRAEQVYEQMLVLRCQIGSEAAFAELIGRYGAALRYYIRKLIGNEKDAEDTLQEVWAHMFRAIRRLEHPEAFKTWIYRIARDQAYWTLRRGRVACVSLDEKELTEPYEEEPGFTSEDAQEVHAALERISTEHREVLLLRFIEGMSADQIGQIVGCPAGTVRSRLHYAKRCLKREMEQRRKDERQ
jgi:RNA polymerase sigma-70 factor, ECF subfamily